VFDLFCMGGSSLDLILQVERLPQADEKLTAHFAGRAAGGLVANAACAAARLGLHTGWSGPLGDDDNGHFVLAEFNSFGVDATCSIIHPGKVSNFCVILLDPSGERTILVVNTIPEPPTLTGEVIQALEQTRFGYTLPQIPTWFEHFANAVHSGGGKVVVDLESVTPVRGVELLNALRQTQILFTNRSGLAQVSPSTDLEAAANSLIELGVEEVIITLGAAGATAFTRQSSAQVTGFRVPVIDSTGSGDCFHAAYLVALQAGKPLAERLRFAAAAAALKIQKLGPRAGLPTLVQVEQFLSVTPYG
jgi:sugar/nucleoside kinase (ribokinase family)